MRSAPLFQGNIEPAIQEILGREPPDRLATVYVAKGLELWWQFYAIKHHRADLLARVVFIEPPDIDRVPAGAFILVSVQSPLGEATAGALSKAGATTVRSVYDIDGARSFAVMQR